MRSRRLLAAAAATAAAGLGMLGAAPHADAVQTATLSITAAPADNGTPRSSLVGAGSRRVDDAVIVADRGTAPITVTLGVVSVSKGPNGYTLGGPLNPLAAAVRPATTTLQLQPGQTVRVPVLISPFAGPQTFAAVTAQAQGSVSAGSIDVVERLAVLVQSDPSPVLAAASAHHSGIWAGWPALAGIALAAVAAASVAERRRSRRDVRMAAAGVPA